MNNNRWRYTQRLAIGIMVIGLMVLGGGAFVLDTGGFDSIATDRGANVVVDDDLDALLNVSADGSQIEDGDFDEPLIINYTNQYDSTIDVTVTIDETDGKDLTVSNFTGEDVSISGDGSETFETKIERGNTEDLNISVDADDENSTISVTVASEFDGATQEFTRGNVTIRG